MKLIPALAVFVGLASGLRSQTATNWTVNDCSGKSHELFADLDAGKVVVIVWVMPCALCINGALTAQTEVQNINSQNPNKVVYYVADDLGNTSCLALQDWCTTNGVTEGVAVSNKSISMTPYGASGMPKIVVVSGIQRQVLYNQNSPNIKATELRDAIASAVVISGVEETYADNSFFKVFPSPTADEITIALGQAKESGISIEVFDASGKKVIECDADPEYSNRIFHFNTSRLANGFYIVSVSDRESMYRGKVLIAR
jgi:hypothetical protein